MSTYLLYKENGEEIFVETDDLESGRIIDASQDDGNVIFETNKKFQTAIKSAKLSAESLIAELKELPVEELEISFGLKSMGEAGIFAIGKFSTEANFQVTLKWKKAS